MQFYGIILRFRLLLRVVGYYEVIFWIYKHREPIGRFIAKYGDAIATTIAVVTIGWDVGFELYPAIMGYLQNAAAPTTFGLQTIAEIVVSASLLYVIHGRKPEGKGERDRITSLISGWSFIVLAIASFIYVAFHWNIWVPYDTRLMKGVTFFELALMVAGIIGNFGEWIIERVILYFEPNATLHAHSHQLALCMLASVMVGVAALAPQYGWPISLSPETFSALVISFVALIAGIQILIKRKSPGHEHSHSHH